MLLFLSAALLVCANDTDKKEAKDYTISFQLGYNTTQTPPVSIKVTESNSAGSAFPENPVRPAWDFKGWKNENGDVYNRDTVIKNDVVLTADWQFTPGTANPVLRDRFTADPAAFVENGIVYLIVGEDELPPDAPSNEYFRITRWVLYSSTDMKTFKFENVILRSDDFPFGQPNTAWASQAIKGLDGRYYFYVTVLFNGGGYEMVVGVAVADNVTGPYVPVAVPVVRDSWVVADTGVTRNANIDPTVFIDDDGQAYLMWGQSPLIAKLKPNMTEIERPIMIWPQTSVNPDGWKTEDKYDEGPYLYKRGNWYYMIYPSGLYGSIHVPGGGGTGAETLSYSMAPHIEGPWTDGVRLTGSAPQLGGGNSYTVHPAILDFRGQTYLFYHNAMLELERDGTTWRGATGRRSVAVDYLYFNKDGTMRSALTMEGISVPPVDP